MVIQQMYVKQRNYQTAPWVKLDHNTAVKPVVRIQHEQTHLNSKFISPVASLSLKENFNAFIDIVIQFLQVTVQYKV